MHEQWYFGDMSRVVSGWLTAVKTKNRMSLGFKNGRSGRLSNEEVDGILMGR